MRRIAATLGVAALLATAGSAARPARAARIAPSAPSHCAAGERVVYSCRFGAKLGSVCLGKSSLHYRFGTAGHPAMDIASTPDWSNIHTGGYRSQGGDNQDSIRFTNGLTHYVVHQDEAGSLNETPGRQFSGIEVLRGSKGEQSLASLSCKARSRFNWQAFDAISDAAPKGWDGAETPGGPFDMVY
jgi:hypothetical protein